MKRRTRKERPSSGGGRWDAGNDSGMPEASQYLFTFEIIRQYPTIRSFLIKQPLKKSFGDTFRELFGNARK
ncbi:MAG: hypothetical protein AB1324_03630 [Candidatus Micrarchaeota archaeon]